jgi:hypothetical protein
LLPCDMMSLVRLVLTCLEIPFISLINYVCTYLVMWCRKHFLICYFVTTSTITYMIRQRSWGPRLHGLRHIQTSRYSVSLYIKGFFPMVNAISTFYTWSNSMRLLMTVWYDALVLNFLYIIWHFNFLSRLINCCWKFTYSSSHDMSTLLHSVLVLPLSLLPWKNSDHSVGVYRCKRVSPAGCS